ncbi:MAG: DNA polymerase I [Planctomycetes bacterium]|nr:DNA polymerase I [Planctomycetota bacterium]
MEPDEDPSDQSPPAAPQQPADSAKAPPPGGPFESAHEPVAAHEPVSAREPVKPASDLSGCSVYVIDAFSLIFQVFHALPEMTSPQGEPVAAVYGFARDMLALLQTRRPNYLFCAFDLPGDTFRTELYPEYKANRGAMPADLSLQIPLIRRLLEAMRIPVIDFERHEADDVMATMARQVAQLGGDCFLVSSDKDCRQLIGERVSIYNIRKDETYGAASLAEDWKVRPDQVIDFQALVGDAVDNVPGVPLIGPKIAGQLLAEHDTLEAVLDGAPQMKKGKRRDNLIEFRDQALLSRELVALKTDLPLQIDWAAGHVGQFDQPAILDLLAELGFRGLKDRVAALEGGDAPKQWVADYQTIDTPAKFATFLAELKQQDSISFDTETTSLRAREAEIVGYALAWQPGRAFYLPVRAPAGESVLDPQETLDALRPILEDAAVKKIGQNLKYDLVVMRSAGVELSGIEYDTMIASYLLSAGERTHNLDDLAQRYLNHSTTKISELIGTGKDQKRMDQVPVSQTGPYAAEDADIPLRLRPILSAKMAESELVELFNEVEIPLVEVLAELEYNGIKVDRQRLAELGRKYGERIEQLEQEIHEIAGGQFNIASTKQLGRILFDELKLPVLKKTKTGASTDASVLEQLAKIHPLPAKIVEYRQYAKHKTTYVDALLKLINEETGRVHASFNQVVAATGRLSSSDPNLQNIPVRSEAGREIRSAFLAGQQGWSLLAADYSQIELRILAHFSRDEALCAAFARDEDIHARVASKVHGVSLEDVTSDMRRAAKAVNFGVIYGQSAFGLAKSLDIEQDEAAEFIASYFAQYPGVVKFLQATLVEGRKNGYVKTIRGRRRTINGIRSAAGESLIGQMNLPERTAVNTVIQGSAADLIKIAMVNVHRRMRREGLAAKMLLQIHDELIFEVPPAEFDQLKDLVVGEMVQALPLEVPVKVDVKSGHNWAELEPTEGGNPKF